MLLTQGYNLMKDIAGEVSIEGWVIDPTYEPSVRWKMVKSTVRVFLHKNEVDYNESEFNGICFMLYSQLFIV